MTDAVFISPTIQFLYDKDPNWTSDGETLYKYGFSKRSMVDVHGFDVRGFNKDGVDRLGCSIADYENPDIGAIAAMAGERFSLSNKLATPMPAFLALRPVFERLCGQKWDTAPGWTFGFDNLPADGKKHLFYDLQSELVIGLYWHDELDGRENYLMLRTDVIAKLNQSDPEAGIPFRIASVGQGSDYELTEDVRFATNAAQARAIIEDHIDRHLQPVRAWTILIQDSPDGSVLGAYAARELEGIEGDPVLSPVVAMTKEEALQSVMDNAKTGTLRDMASGGLLALTGHPALYRAPRPL